MIAEIIHQLDFNLAYAKKLVEGIPENLLTKRPNDGLENHPAWTIGHLATAYANLMNNLTGEFILADGYKELFLRTGPGDPRLPESDSSAYPAMENLISELTAQHERLVHHLLQMDEKKLKEKFEWRFSSFFPTYYDRIMFLCVNHYAMHLGQLAAWRRAMGFTSALAELK
ncbi:DinB family protein [soil metagenome]